MTGYLIGAADRLREYVVAEDANCLQYIIVNHFESIDGYRSDRPRCF